MGLREHNSIILCKKITNRNYLWQEFEAPQNWGLRHMPQILYARVAPRC